MARVITEISVFISSPGDVTDERMILEEIVSKLNPVFSKHHGLRLDLVKWETHCTPGISTDVQSNINEQIEDDYDIFIGIMWKRFGTPTPRAGSGTAEEFERAYDRYKLNQKNLRVMFYFKETPASISELDPDQLALIKGFRRKLGEEGVLYWTFKSEMEFQLLLQTHLTSKLLEWGKSWGSTAVKQTELDGQDTTSSLPAHGDRLKVEAADLKDTAQDCRPHAYGDG